MNEKGSTRLGQKNRIKSLCKFFFTSFAEYNILRSSFRHEDNKISIFQNWMLPVNSDNKLNWFLAGWLERILFCRHVQTFSKIHSVSHPTETWGKYRRWKRSESESDQCLYKTSSLNSLPSLTLQSARDLNDLCRPKLSKALLLSYTFKCPLKKTQSFCPCSRALNRSGKGLKCTQPHPQSQLHLQEVA
jgi:hypothetical protein